VSVWAKINQCNCTKCKSGIGKLIKEVMRINERLNIVEDCMRKVDEKMEKMRNALSSQVDKA